MERDLFARSLGESRTYLTELWERSVRNDPRIVSDEGLSTGQLRDAIPIVVGEIADAIAAGEPPTVVSGREARLHVYTRFRQGYRARDVVRELSLLRLVVLDFLAATATAPRADVAIAEFAEAVRIVNLFVDEEMRYAITIYTETDPTA
jgi:hypothetical protein